MRAFLITTASRVPTGLRGRVYTNVRRKIENQKLRKNMEGNQKHTILLVSFVHQ